jgi:hypothetical protein
VLVGDKKMDAQKLVDTMKEEIRNLQDKEVAQTKDLRSLIIKNELV